MLPYIAVYCFVCMLFCNLFAVLIDCYHRGEKAVRIKDSLPNRHVPQGCESLYGHTQRTRREKPLAIAGIVCVCA